MDQKNMAFDGTKKAVRRTEHTAVSKRCMITIVEKVWSIDWHVPADNAPKGAIGRNTPVAASLIAAGDPGAGNGVT